MRFMNDFDIEQARRLAAKMGWHNVYRGADIIDNLRDWADNNSDGWAHWPKPALAAASLMALVDDIDRRRLAMNGHDVPDITDAELRKALKPIRAFLTRQGVDHAEVVTFR